MRRDPSVHPFGEGGDAILIVGDDGGDVTRDGRDLGEEARVQAATAGPTDDIVRRVLVRVRRLLALGPDDLEDGVDAQAVMRVLALAPTVDKLKWQVGGVDAAGEELGRVIVEVLGIVDWFIGSK